MEVDKTRSAERRNLESFPMPRPKSAITAASSATNGVTPYIAPKERMLRWRCSRTQVDRVARRQGLKRIMLGHGRNGMVRYLLIEVEAMEQRCTV